MTEIDFYTNVEDRQRITCQLVRKAYASRLRVLVLLEDEQQLTRFDEYLWRFQPQAFVPHCRLEDPLAAETPVLLTCTEGGALPHDDLLVNLRNSAPQAFARFRRLLEVVSTETADRLAARERFKFYRDRGYPLRAHAPGEQGGWKLVQSAGGAADGDRP